MRMRDQQTNRKRRSSFAFLADCLQVKQLPRLCAGKPWPFAARIRVKVDWKRNEMVQCAEGTFDAPLSQSEARCTDVGTG